MWRDQFRQESELRQILSAMKAKRCALRGIAGNCMAQFIDIDYRHQFDGLAVVRNAGSRGDLNCAIARASTLNSIALRYFSKRQNDPARWSFALRRGLLRAAQQRCDAGGMSKESGRHPAVKREAEEDWGRALRPPTRKF